MIGTKDLAEDKRMEHCRLKKMLAIFDDQKPVRGKLSQQKILWRKDVTLRKVQNSINQSMFSDHFTESTELTAQHTPVKTNTEKQIRFLRRKY